MKMSPSPADAGSDTSESVETADTAALTASSQASSVLTSSSSSSSTSSVLTSSTSSDHSSELGTSDTDQHQTQSDRNHGSNSANNTAKEEYNNNNNNNNNNNSAVIPPGDTLEYVLVTDNLSEPNLVVLDKSNDEVVDNSGHSEANSGHSGDNSTVITLTTPPDRSSASVMHISQTR